LSPGRAADSEWISDVTDEHSPHAASVSVVITCFNQAQYLAEAIESALAQSRKPDEVIVVDDGSTDNTSSISKSFSPVVHLQQPNKGLAAARNFGLRRASASHVLFLDADDVLTPTAIEYCLNAVAAEPDVAFVYGGFRYVDAERRLIAEAHPEEYTDQFEGLLRRNHIAMHGTVMYRADILRQIGAFDETLPCCEDYDVFLRVAQKYRISAYGAIAAEYRQHQGNMTRNAPLMLRVARLVLARNSVIAQRSPGRRAAYLDGHRFWCDYYGELILEAAIEESKGAARLGRLASLVTSGILYDKRFMRRLAGRCFRVVKRHVIPTSFS
jgi:glycosyltransferase involved in cell wall biosynthesis